MNTIIKNNQNAVKMLYSGVIYDAMHQDIKYDKPFVVHNSIMNICGDSIYGPAFTCQGETINDPSEICDYVRIDMLRHMTPGCVKIISTGSDIVAVTGDITCEMDFLSGSIGAIVDGFTRDVDIIRNNLPQFSLFARGVSPIDAYGKWQITRYQVPVFLPGMDGDVLIEPGDFIFADASGILVIPAAIHQQVMDLAVRRAVGEQRIRARLRRGDSIREVYEEEERW